VGERAQAANETDSIDSKCFLETNPIPIKTALSLMGKCTGAASASDAHVGRQLKNYNNRWRIRFALVPMALASLFAASVGAWGAVVRAAAQTAGVRLAAAIDKPGSARWERTPGNFSADIWRT
jgi:hypothetical protein